MFSRLIAVLEVYIVLYCLPNDFYSESDRADLKATSWVAF